MKISAASHRKLFVCLLIAASVVLLPSASTHAATPGGKFDPARHIDIDEIHRGMTGYGLTVFHGAQPERFPIEVVSVMRNFEVQHDAILIRVVDNDAFARANGVQGVSGSPVYINGRIAGAMAFGWSESKEPLYGVTPIREMLEVRRARESTPPTVATTTGARLPARLYRRLFRPELLTTEQKQRVLQRCGLLTDRSRSSTGLTVLPTALTCSNVNSACIARLENYFGAFPFRSNSTGAGRPSTTPAADMRPGGTVAVPLISGDMNAAILGTITDVIGDQVYAFGHGWNGTGAAAWPMSGGFIHTFVSRSSESFKLGDATEIVGTLLADEFAAVYGELGASPPLTPVRVQMTWEQRGYHETVNASIARNADMDPVLATLTVLNAVLRHGDLPEEHCLTYSVQMRFEKNITIDFENVSSSNHVNDILDDVFTTLVLLLGNPWQEVQLLGLDTDVTILSEDRLSYLEEARIDAKEYHPGDTVTIHTVSRGYRGERRRGAISLTLPDTLPPDTYDVFIGSWSDYRQQLQSAQPHRFSANSLEQAYKVLQRRLDARRDRLYATLILPKQGLAFEHQALPALPASQAMMLTDPSRQNFAFPHRSIIEAQQERTDVILGNTKFEIDVVEKNR